jgi:transposase
VKAKRATDARKLSHATLEAIRIRAVKQVEAGESPEAVIAALGMNPRNIYRWIALYREGGEAALKAKALKGRAPKLTGPQLRWIRKTVVGKSPLQLGFEFALWTREMVRDLIRRKYGLRLHIVSVGRLLKKLGLSPQKPLHRAFQQNPKLIQAWLDEEFPRIQAQAKREGAEIFFGDEAGVRSDYHAGTSWGERGETPVVIGTGARFSLNMISAISPKGVLRFMTVRGGVGAKVFVTFLKRFILGVKRPQFLILDGHPSHRSKLVREFVESTEGKLRIFFLPPYSPELNPDELVWNNVKNRVGRSMLAGPIDMQKRVHSQLRWLQKNPQVVRNFFQEPHVQYAAAA